MCLQKFSTSFAAEDCYPELDEFPLLDIDEYGNF